MSGARDWGLRNAIWCTLVAGSLLVSTVPARPQSQAGADPTSATADPASTGQPAPEAAAAPDREEAAVLTEEELDGLVAPIALYPDALLAQVFVAATYPLDVVKASRWVAKNQDMPEGERTDATTAEGWDPSVAVLAAGFPSVIEKMAGDLDRTELLGDAMLTQSDDVLEATQRMRAQAAAMGNLPSNEAQTVTVEGDSISIAPTQPEVVYVPTYDSQAIYTTPARPAPAIVETTGTSYPATGTVVVDDDDDGFSTGAMITTGLLSFGAGMLVNEIFDDDDDWHGYWGPSYGPIGWDDDYFRPYPPGWHGGNNDIDVNFDRDTTINLDRDGNWRPDPDRREQAREKIAERRGISTLPAGAGDDGRAALKQKMEARGGGASGREKLLADRDGIQGQIGDRAGAGLAAGDAGARLAKRTGAGKLASRKPGGGGSAFAKDTRNLTAAKRASNRGKLSTARAGKPHGGKGLHAGGGAPRVAHAGGGRPAARRGSAKDSAFHKGGGGRHASAAKSRGAKSRGGGRAGGRRH
jgi:Protein of unknown function (DUF3300)